MLHYFLTALHGYLDPSVCVQFIIKGLELERAVWYHLTVFRVYRFVWDIRATYVLLYFWFHGFFFLFFFNFSCRYVRRTRFLFRVEMIRWNFYKIFSKFKFGGGSGRKKSIFVIRIKTMVLDVYLFFYF